MTTATIPQTQRPDRQPTVRAQILPRSGEATCCKHGICTTLPMSTRPVSSAPPMPRSPFGTIGKLARTAGRGRLFRAGNTSAEARNVSVTSACASLKTFTAGTTARSCRTTVLASRRWRSPPTILSDSVAMSVITSWRGRASGCRRSPTPRRRRWPSGCSPSRAGSRPRPWGGGCASPTACARP